MNCMYTRIKPMFKRATAAILTSIALTMLIPAAAQQSELQSYDVELVIFRHLASNATPEQRSFAAQLGSRLGVADSDSSMSDLPAEQARDTTLESIATLPAAKFKLTAIEDALRRSRNYRPIAHFGWTQPGYPINEAHFLPVDSLVPASSGLSGRIALSRGRYLHLTLDLEYVNPEAGSDPSVRHVLEQSRRMRSNERHYIDHPEFGVIAVVTPTTS